MTPIAFRRALPLVVLLVGAAPGLAENAQGIWLVQERDAQVRIGPCGDANCGWISCVKGSKGRAKLGQRVLWDMKQGGDGVWKGKAFNPRDGNTYSGEMTVSGNDLSMRGCALRGLLCKTSHWVRVK